MVVGAAHTNRLSTPICEAGVGVGVEPGCLHDVLHSRSLIPQEIPEWASRLLAVTPFHF